MKHLVIRNLGPLKEADIELKRINVIIGPQSSGKSCVLKTACYCTWVEKRIELTQTAEFFAKDNNFLNKLERFHKLKGYIKDDTFISYESDYMMFSYDNATKTFLFNWKNDRWKYRRSKVTYIPAERNLVAAIPNWFEVKFAEYDNILNFMSDWQTASRSTTNNLSVLNLGVSYHYDANTNSDKVQVDDDVTLDLTNTSSGLQSLIPMFVHLNHLIVQVGKTAELSVMRRNEINDLTKHIFDNFSPLYKREVSEDVGQKHSSFVLETNEESYIFQKSDIKKMEDIISQYIVTDHCDIFLEEPEANLFPPTQSSVVEWLLAMTTGEQSNNLFVATHSPYILNSFLEKKNILMTLLYTRMSDGQMVIRTATEEDIQGIYDFGVDAFFNIESLG